MKRGYLLVILALVVLVNVPPKVAAGLRGAVAAVIVPLSGSSREAKVVYRSPATWNSTCWVNVGEMDGILRDSPVVISDSLIGVIDYVGRRQARVRLITDSGLHPSVRVQRDGAYFAKGELHGSGQPLWRGQGQRLRGIGFNYDHPDEYGPAHDLGTNILQRGDHLVTTGMDGVFPAGLLVARIVDVDTLREGSYFYELTAYPLAGNLEDLSEVTILSPVGFDHSEVTRAQTQ